MGTLAIFTKQPADVQDFDVDFTQYLTDLSDTGVSHIATVETGITLDRSTLAAGVVKVWLSGGTDGWSYKVTATLTTTGGRVKQAEITVRVKET